MILVFCFQFSRDMVVNVYSEYVNNFPMAMEEIKAAQISKPGLEEFLNVSYDRVTYCQYWLFCYFLKNRLSEVKQFFFNFSETEYVKEEYRSPDIVRSHGKTNTEIPSVHHAHQG